MNRRSPRQTEQFPAASLRDFPRDQRYLVGVSGGRDSVALLHWLVGRGFKGLHVCHLNHKLRGRAADADSRFVQRLAADLGLRCTIDSIQVAALAKRSKQSIETTARKARYEFFARVAKRTGISTIFLAHHADDLVETFLWNLFRGAGTSGLAAMRSVTTHKVKTVDLTVVRPMLAVWRKEIDAYVRKHRLSFREDASNKNLEPLRNRIRLRVIPYLEKQLDRHIRGSIWRAAMIAADEESYIESLLEPAHPRAGKPMSDRREGAPAPPKTVDLIVDQLRSLPVALQRRAILGWLRAQGVADVGFDVVERVRELIDPAVQIAKTNLPRARHVRRRAKKLFVE